MDFREIAKAHNRTVPSIVARLVKLGKIAPAAAANAAKSGSLGRKVQASKGDSLVKT